MPSPSITTTGRSVLLVEEYDALAVAIRSALQKFAPHHRAHVVCTLADAKRVASTEQPELIIVDYDPPQSGAIAFFQEMRDTLPHSRALVIAAGISREILAERGSECALQFLEKPFELVEFGAAVQALLGPWMETGTSRGTLERLGVGDIAMLAALHGGTPVVQIRDGSDRAGHLHFANGQLLHAAAEDREGERAFIEMLTWSDLRFSEAPRSLDTKQTIQRPFASVYAESLREAKRLRPLPAKAKTAGTTVAASPAIEKTGPQIVIIDDTEMLLIFVEDSLSLADPTLRITTASGGLQGIKEVSRIRPDLVLLDYSLPDLRGDEVARRLLTDKETARIPIVMMSGHVIEMNDAASRFANIVATISKPFLSDDLMKLVKKMLASGPVPEPIAEILPEIEPASPAPRIVDEPKPEPPPKKSRPIAPSVIEIMQPQLGRDEPAPLKVLPPIASAKLPTLSPSEVLLDLPLEVIAMQFDSVFQIGSIRARPASPTVALEIPALAARASLPLETGFQLGPIELDANGRIATVRLIPTTEPFRAVESRSAFNIGGLTVVPANERERLQLMSVATGAMTMQLYAPLELSSVELNANFEVNQLLLRCRNNAVRVTLNASAADTRSGASFETVSVSLDDSRRIRELTLAPAA
ncbi:MAG: response regulator [Verrucomicrobiota bacterium]|nr:response regulator [Verrucomicrobiota bacterium]